jgi:hypothetical protein
VWLLSQDKEGCRQVQAAFVDAPSDEARADLAAELHGHVAKAMRCPHANHVLQKVIAVVRPESLHFVVDELLARDGLAVQAAKHRYGCRVVQHTLRQCPAPQTADLVEVLLREAKALSCHTIGHYTVQQLLEFGTEDQRYRLVRAIERSMPSIGLSAPGGAVVQAALLFAEPADRIWISRAVLQHLEVLLPMAKEKQGSAALVQVLQTLQGRESEHARSIIMEHAHIFRASKWGRAVVEQAMSGGRPQDWEQLKGERFPPCL